MRTSLIITSYHSDPEMVALTEACVASLANGRPDEVIVVDDCSPIFIGLSGVDAFIRREENGGFPKCANTGWAEATGDVLILSNNDIKYTPGWLEAILKPLKEGYDISSILVSDGDGKDTRDEIEEDGYFGSLWAQTRKVYDKLGGFDESFDKGTFEDKDYFVRAKRAGFKIAKYHGAYVDHVGRATMDKLYPDRIDFHEGLAKFNKKHGFTL
jgi:GT2 family glycosyltransferase